MVIWCRECEGCLAGPVSTDSDYPKTTNDSTGYIVGDDVSAGVVMVMKVASLLGVTPGWSGGEEPGTSSFGVDVVEIVVAVE